MATAHKLNPPFRADHVGSLKRPEHLQRARERLLGEHDADNNLSGHDNAELRALEDRCIEEAIALQESIGLQSITDGDFRRRTWWTDFVLGFDGIDVSMAGKSKLQFHNEDGSVRPMPTIEVTDNIRWCGSTMVEAFKFLKAKRKELGYSPLHGCA